ncbi:hypothetical protein Vadar_017069 [Vaccinium darrowii]|uniref:Uncharacterized protein n=1 Tax=Vaccinium darrowii TaxID=229202 RepID=A0ACB7XRC3_9ERIC|nr:hypothetical protein Vadar_017069 [Vaccinium darrowii]
MGKEKFRVEYTSLLKENQKGPLKEVVKASELRPVPPEIRVSSLTCWTRWMRFSGCAKHHYGAIFLFSRVLIFGVAVVEEEIKALFQHIAPADATNQFGGSSPEAEVELVCKSPENGTVTFTSHGSVNNSGIYNLHMEPGHQHDLCKVHVVSSSDPLCHVKVPGFQSTSVHFKNGTESKGQVLIGFVNKESLHNCRKIKGRGGKLVPTVYSDMTLGEANLI